MTPDTRILVTGAGGFIGGWTVESLWFHGFRRVVAGVRRWSRAARISRFPIEIVLCDVLNMDQVEKATEGVDAIVHCAVGTEDVIIKGTENLLKAAHHNRVGRFIHLSTINVYGEVEGEVDENYPFMRTGNSYGDSKIEAEKLCQKYVDRGVSVVVLRPTIVYGPYCTLWVKKFAERMRSGKWGIFRGIGEGTCNLVYVQDVVNAIILCLQSERAVGEAFNVNGSEQVTWNEYFCRLNAALGLPPLSEIDTNKAEFASTLVAPLKATARFVVNHYGDMLTRIYQRSAVARRIMKRAEESMIATPGKAELRQFSRKARYSISKARSVLGYEPRVDLNTGVQLSAQWLHHESLFHIRSEESEVPI